MIYGTAAENTSWKDRLSQLLKHFMFICGDDPPAPYRHQPTHVRTRTSSWFSFHFVLIIFDSFLCHPVRLFVQLLNIKMPLFSSRGDSAATSAIKCKKQTQVSKTLKMYN